MIQINLNKAKAIAHEARRAARAEEFAPLDQQISAQIPGTDIKVAEEKRAAIRTKYADMQAAIDAATSPEEIKAAAGETL